VRRLAASVVLLLLLPGCATTGSGEAFSPATDRAAYREFQTRRFDGYDGKQLLSSVMAAMQELEFVIDDVEPPLGVVTGTRIAQGQRVRLSVAVRPLDEDSYGVRATAYRGPGIIDNPRTYQGFFDTLALVMALP
jgi:hypothetical protein